VPVQRRLAVAQYFTTLPDSEHSGEPLRSGSGQICVALNQLVTQVGDVQMLLLFDVQGVSTYAVTSHFATVSGDNC
jgi:hypothetical protein